MGDTTLRKALDDYKSVYMPYRNFAEHKVVTINPWFFPIK